MWRTPLGQAPVPNVDTRSARHVVGEGALRGRSPRTREGACARPPRTAVVSCQWLVQKSVTAPPLDQGLSWTVPGLTAARGLRGLAPILVCALSLLIPIGWRMNTGNHCLNSHDGPHSRKPDYSTGPPVGALLRYGRQVSCLQTKKHYIGAAARRHRGSWMSTAEHQCFQLIRGESHVEE